MDTRQGLQAEGAKQAVTALPALVPHSEAGLSSSKQQPPHLLLYSDGGGTTGSQNPEAPRALDLLAEMRSERVSAPS